MKSTSSSTAHAIHSMLAVSAAAPAVEAAPTEAAAVEAAAEAAAEVAPARRASAEGLPAKAMRREVVPRGVAPPAPRSPPGVEEKARCEAEDEPRGCAPDEAGAEAIGVGRADPHVSDPRVVPVAGAVDDDAARRDVGAVVAGCVADIYDVGRRVVDADEGHVVEP